MGHSDELTYNHLDDVVHYYALRPFTVDGIRYHRLVDAGVDVARPMIQLIHDQPDTLDDLDQFPSDPPTDKELDAYVRHGILPST